MLSHSYLTMYLVTIVVTEETVRDSREGDRTIVDGGQWVLDQWTLETQKD